ncbi:kinesin-like protein KIF28P [Lingula anatina]|uniref:Kinesin-like protein 6 n=1 Tax=Lingula anatina TaxID=7574 RepID=A0A1S3I5N7_LINAN|nr:kinesin-like protein KIF28P [Lingula anatina]|eukprot:XP_013392684.1 kinesin-like protein KIF28P [Lingula anatina]
MAEESVKVAVRLRPFNSREKARNATLIIDMKGPTTYIKDPSAPSEEAKSFTFDYSYWSHDGSKLEGDGYIAPDPGHPNGKKFADQKTVFQDLGMGVLTNAWDGFNSTLFAYGQTGSGKSWSVVGYGVNRGIVPQFCEEVFNRVDAEKNNGSSTQFEVNFSMLEIYNEIVRDLLNPGSGGKGGLKVRQHPKKGFYAQGLTSALVSSYNDIEKKMEEGTTNRTVAATNMNATSSRAHTIVGITLIQKFKNAAGEETAKTGIVNLVDLAGSERADSTGATGDRLKEGAAINQSLSSLGNVISALAEKSSGKNTRVPYRNSVLTMLLKNALGGNSKTIMIAALSPADINYDETLSTLRYADRAKQIKTKATVNEDPTEKLIRELQEENERLKKMMEGGNIQVPRGDGDDEIQASEGMSEEEIAALKKQLEEEYKAELEENAKQMEEMKKAYEDKLRESQEDSKASSLSDTQAKKQTVPHLSNLNFDPQLTGKIVYFIDGDTKTVGNKKGEQSDIVLAGPSIMAQHAVFTVEGGKIFLEKMAANARLLMNGDPVNQKTEVKHNARLMFGTTQLYLFVNPKERDAAKTPYPEITFEMAQDEIAACSGFDMNTENKSQDDLLLQEDLADMIPAVEEANSISQELDKKLKFEIIIVSSEARGELSGRTEVMVRVSNLETGYEWVWSKNKFIDRKYVMQELFQKYDDGETWDVPPEQDPFYENPEDPVHIGSVKVWLQSLAYLIELKEQLEITDFRGRQMGIFNLEVVPCNKKGKEYTEADDVFVDDPEELVGKDLHFMVKVNSARGIPARYTDLYARFIAPGQTDFTETAQISGTSNPNWNFKKQYDLPVVKPEHVKMLRDGAMMVQIWGDQKSGQAKKSVNTKKEMEKLSMAAQQVHHGNANVKTVDAGKVKYMMQSALLEKRQKKYEEKMSQLRKMVKVANSHHKVRVETKVINEVLNASSWKEAEKQINKIPKDSGGDEIPKSGACTIL